MTKTPNINIKNNNINREGRNALKHLADDHTIVIKPADKGGAIVIQDRDKYIAEGIRQLSNPDFYTETDTDLTQQHFQEVKNELDEMQKRKEIDISCYLYLTHTPIRTAQFYMLSNAKRTPQEDLSFPGMAVRQKGYHNLLTISFNLVSNSSDPTMKTLHTS